MIRAVYAPTIMKLASDSMASSKWGNSLASFNSIFNASQSGPSTTISRPSSIHSRFNPKPVR